MQCEECGQSVRRAVRDLHLHDTVVGELFIPGADVWQCGACGAMMFPAATAVRISSARQQRTRELVSQFAVAEFVTLGDAAKLLGQTKQALSKNPKIKNGFIYSSRLGKRAFYLKASVLAFKSSGDGRLRLASDTAGMATYCATNLTDGEPTALVEDSTGNAEDLVDVSFASTSKELAYA